MKFVKGISLFLIYPLTMFGLGFAANMAVSDFFYPGDKQEERKATAEQKTAENSFVETGYLGNSVVTADTSYVVLSYDIISGELQEKEETTPDKYIGLDRDRLEAELKIYAESPSLTDLEKGFRTIELISFSPAKVVVRKNYEKKEEGFFLVNENNMVVVYDKSLSHIYMDTGIRTDELPWKVQSEIMCMKYIETESELYHFLESYSS